MRDFRNAAWSTKDVRAQYSYANAHSDLYRYINQWSDMEMYLNVGYSRWLWQPHHRTANHLRLIDRLAKGLLQLADGFLQQSPFHLVDIGSGRGGAALRANHQYGLQVTGIDFTPYNVRRAASNSKEKGIWPAVRFSMGDAHHLPIRTASVPLAWSIESPAHFRDKSQFLREVHRILKPGGLFAFSDLLVVESVVLANQTNRDIYRDFLQVWDVPYLETLDSYIHALESAGFQLLRHEIATRYNLDIYQKYCRWFLRLCRLPRLYESYKKHLRQKIDADLDNIHRHSLLSYRALRLGMIDYGLFWAKKL